MLSELVCSSFQNQGILVCVFLVCRNIPFLLSTFNFHTLHKCFKNVIDSFLNFLNSIMIHFRRNIEEDFKEMLQTSCTK